MLFLWRDVIIHEPPADVTLSEERTSSCLLHSSVNEQNNRFSTAFSLLVLAAARFNRTEEKSFGTPFQSEAL